MFLVFGKYSVRAGKLPQQVDSNPWSCYELMVLAIATPCQPLMFWYSLFMASLADHLIWLFEAKENTTILLWAVRLSCINIMCLVPLWMQSVHMCVCATYFTGFEKFWQKCPLSDLFCTFNKIDSYSENWSWKQIVWFAINQCVRMGADAG